MTNACYVTANIFEIDTEYFIQDGHLSSEKQACNKVILGTICVKVFFQLSKFMNLACPPALTRTHDRSDSNLGYQRINLRLN